jgi:hypothetical protein
VANCPGETSLADDRTPTLTPAKAERDIITDRQTIKASARRNSDRVIIA